MRPMRSKALEEIRDRVLEYHDLKQESDALNERLKILREDLIQKIDGIGRTHFLLKYDGGKEITADLSHKEYANCFDVPGFYDALQNGDKRNFKHVVKVSMPKALKMLKGAIELKGKHWDVEVRPTLTVRKIS
jgi:hypothetical protein